MTRHGFQGTVWDPMFWNIFHQDGSTAIRFMDFVETVFADDLNAFKEYGAEVTNRDIRVDIDSCQRELHKWGKANQVTFDAGKESKHILSRKQPHGSSFESLGVAFDTKLIMADPVYGLAKDCRWKLKAILRTCKYNTSGHLVISYKAQLLSFIEYRTVAIYHACKTALGTLDHVQERLIAAVGASPEEALISFRLAPLSSRRDMAMLGLIHRAVLGGGPAHFRQFFKIDTGESARREGRHRLQLIEYSEGHWSDFVLPNSRPADYIKHSLLGLVTIYNRLPPWVVESSSSVSQFQRALQSLLTNAAGTRTPDWENTFSPRVPWHRHPLQVYS